MSPQQIVTDASAKFQSGVGHFQEEAKKLRTGRAHAGILDGIMVEAYGVPTPINQVANITAPEAQLLQITPFDPSNIAVISAAIRDNQSLGLNPSDDGHIVRISIPPLNEERRRDFVKLLGGKVEDTMVSLRNVRHDALKTIDQAKKDKDISEDDAKRLEKQVDEAMNEAKATIEGVAKAKETEIMTI
jgi:ribosome recycling factor